MNHLTSISSNWVNVSFSLQLPVRKKVHLPRFFPILQKIFFYSFRTELVMDHRSLNWKFKRPPILCYNHFCCFHYFHRRARYYLGWNRRHSTSTCSQPSPEFFTSCTTRPSLLTTFGYSDIVFLLIKFLVRWKFSRITWTIKTFSRLRGTGRIHPRNDIYGGLSTISFVCIIWAWKLKWNEMKFKTCLANNLCFVNQALHWLQVCYIDIIFITNDIDIIFIMWTPHSFHLCHSCNQK